MQPCTPQLRLCDEQTPQKSIPGFPGILSLDTADKRTERYHKEHRHREKPVYNIYSLNIKHRRDAAKPAAYPYPPAFCQERSKDKIEKDRIMDGRGTT